MQDVDVAVIGAGPAGMAAAIKAREAGAEKVILMERAEELGGLLHQCVHNGFGLLYFNEDLSGPEYGHRFIEKVMDTGVTPLLETMVVRLGQDRQIGAVNTREGFITFRPKSIVLAMGCRERSRGALNIPGTRPAGVLTAGTAQRFVNVEGFVPGKKIVILGSGDIGMIMARRLTLEGAQVEAVVEILPYIGGLIRNEVQCLHDFEIPLFLEHTVTRIHGEQRLEAVTIARVDGQRNPVAGTQRVIACDSLLLSVGLIPENELSLMAGIQLDPVTGGALVDETRQTTVPGVFAGGNVLHVHDLVDNVSWESELAGESAARFAAAGKPEARGEIKVKAGRNIRYVVPQTISGRKDTTLYMRVSEPEETVRIKVGNITTKGMRAVKPSEMLKIELSADKLEKLKEGTQEIIVDCEKRGGK
ncbi:MAG: FAD-dependent oxidoreductase [Deltaproteobacteria bacterium]|nr:FAD-dependent oxidoreductase [Deltaproteobacteria bacterium]